MQIAYGHSALDQLHALPQNVQLRIIKKPLFFAAQPEPLSFAKHLAGHNAYRFRIGDYRAIVEVKVDTLFVLLVVKREGAYRDL